MEIHAYNELYLNRARITMATMLDYAVEYQQENIDTFFADFISSGIAEQFEQGNPVVIAGKSCVDLYRVVKGNFRDNMPDYISFHRTATYWVGWVLAYYQWYANKSFQEIVSVAALSEIESWYPTLHEADVMRFVEIMEDKMKKRETNLEYYRKRAGLSQSQLAALSGVSIRSIQMYEQRQNDISKAQFNILNALAKTLCCSIYDFMDSN